MNTAYARISRGALTVVALGFWLGAGSAHAAPVEVQPGLTCDDFDGIITCTNTTATDYSIIQTRNCLGGSWSDFDYSYGYNPVTGEYDSQPKMKFHSAEPSVRTARIFAAANSTGMGLNDCEYQ